MTIRPSHVALLCTRSIRASNARTLLLVVSRALHGVSIGQSFWRCPHVQDRTTPLAYFVAQTNPMTAAMFPFAIICFADQGISRILAGWAYIIASKEISKATEASVKHDDGGHTPPITKLQTQKLIVTGLYAHVRYPMIFGVTIPMVGLSLRVFNYVFYFVLVKTLWFIVAG